MRFAALFVIVSIPCAAMGAAMLAVSFEMDDVEFFALCLALLTVSMYWSRR